MALKGWLKEKFSREDTVNRGKAEQEAAIAEYAANADAAIRDYSGQANTNLSDYKGDSLAGLLDYQNTATGNLTNYQNTATGNLTNYKDNSLENIDKGISSRTKIIDNSIGELNDLFNEDYYSNYLKRPEVANAIRQKQDQFDESLDQFKGNSVRGGGTIESQLAASGSLGKNYSNFLADLVSQGEDRKSGVKSDYLNRKTGLNLSKSGILGEGTNQRLGVESNALSQGNNIASNVLSGGQNIASNVLSGGQNIYSNALSQGNNIASNVLGNKTNVGSNTLSGLLGASQQATNSILNIKNDRLGALSQGLDKITGGGLSLLSGGGEGGGDAGTISKLLPLLTAASDIKFKENIKHVATVKGVKFYNYNYRKEFKGLPKGEQFGVIAQEVEHIPGAVIKKENGKYVDYSKIKSFING